MTTAVLLAADNSALSILSIGIFWVLLVSPTLSPDICGHLNIYISFLMANTTQVFHSIGCKCWKHFLLRVHIIMCD